MIRKIWLAPVLALVLLATSCKQCPDPPVILVSREYGNVMLNWLSRVDNTIERISMYTVSNDSINYFLEKADGIIISGGPDVNPALYGQGSELERCGPIDYRRDTLELKMISYAIDHDIPLLCICRGHQILNVAEGGSLIIDIPSDHDTIILHRQEGKHMVRVVEGTNLASIVGCDSGLVNSRHHQAVKTIAPGYLASAYASDGIIEAIEPAEPGGHPFILGLQWHPESMIRESDSPFTLPIAIRFMDAVDKKNSK